MKSLNIIIYKLSYNLENSGMHSVQKINNEEKYLSRFVVRFIFKMYKFNSNRQTNKLRGLSPQARTTNRATAACRRS
jgi:hypothetical protein